MKLSVYMAMDLCVNIKIGKTIKKWTTWEEMNVSSADRMDPSPKS